MAVGPDGAVYVANAGRGGKLCQGKGEDKFCLGMTGSIVKVANGKKSIVAKGLLSAAGARRRVRHGRARRLGGAGREGLRRQTSGTPKDIRARRAWARKQAGRLFDVTSGRTPVANISLIEWNRNLDKVKGDRNSNPYAVLALADRQIVVDAGANAVLQVVGGKISVLAVIPKNGKSQAVPTSIAQGLTATTTSASWPRAPARARRACGEIPAAGGTPEVYATGFTTITGVAFGPDGSMFVTQFAANCARTTCAARSCGSPRRQPDAAGRQASCWRPPALRSTRPGRLRVELQRAAAQDAEEEPLQGAGGTLVKITPP